MSEPGWVVAVLVMREVEIMLDSSIQYHWDLTRRPWSSIAIQNLCEYFSYCFSSVMPEPTPPPQVNPAAALYSGVNNPHR